MIQNQPQLLKVAIATVIIAGLLGALSILAEGIGVVSGKIFAVCFSLIFYGITASISVFATRKPGYRNLGLAGMLVSAAAFLLMLIVVIGEIADETLLKLMGALFIAAIGLAHISLLHYFNTRNKYAFYARITATIAISLFSFGLILRIFESFSSIYSLMYNQSTLKILVASFVIDLAATLLVPLCNRLPPEKPVELTLMDEPPTSADQPHGL